MPMLTNLRQQLRDGAQRISNHALWQRIKPKFTATLQWLHSVTQRIRNRARAMNTARNSARWKQIKPQLYDFFKLPDAYRYKAWEIILEIVKIIAGLVFLVALVLTWLVAKQMSQDCTGLNSVCYLFGVEDKATVLRHLGFVMAGILSFAGIVIAGKRSQAMTDAVKATTAGQQQERFRDAVTHLGHKKASVRQGGAHALFHLALDEERLRTSIAEILCAHIRETTQSKDYQKTCEHKPSTEIQSLLEMLFVEGKLRKESKDLDAFWKCIRPNLVGCYFRGIELRVAQFRKADLRYTQFQGAWLRKAQFQEALLSHTQFQGAHLDDAQFQGADLHDAQFQGADLTCAKFHMARLSKARFQGAWLSKAQFYGAKLDEAQFQGAALNNVQFQGADLENAQFQGVFQAEGGYTRYCEKRIEERVDDKAELGSVVFSGGLLEDNQVEELVATLKKVIDVSEQKVPRQNMVIQFTAEDIEKFKEEMNSHVGKPKSDIPPDDVVTGAYSEQDAEQWIREYKVAMGKLPDS